ncbi:MAG: phosphatase PAP2 family protein [Phycisphaerales bacterium]|nr:phosphatase PAP2 family protein [Phycisphaerales bacterium]
MPLTWTVVVIAGLLPFDQSIARSVRGVHLGGDIRRELEVLQQFGSISFLVLAILVFVCLQPRRWRRSIDWASAAAVTGVVALVLKILLGRPRPKLMDHYGPTSLLGPFHAHPFGPEEGIHRSWHLWAAHVSDLWSFPSSHTSAAAAMAVGMVAIDRRLRPFAVSMVVLVGTSRVVLGAHYPSDVVFGACVGLICGRWVMREYVGTRTLDWLWRLSHPRATPAAPRVRLAEASSRYAGD